MLLSVIISTCNRAERLPQLFQAMEQLEIAPGMSWELVMIDNGSRDETWGYLQRQQARGRLPLICLQQPAPGKSNALNLALTSYRGELAVFTDDDVVPSTGWLKAYYQAALAHPQMLAFAGKVLPLWEGPVPSWLRTEGEFAVPRGIINSRDFGDAEHVLPESVIPGGVNTALRRSALDRMGQFCARLGPGTAFPYAEDTEYMRRLFALGGRFLYVPLAVIHHRNPASRMTQDYAARWMYQTGLCQVIAFKASTSGPTMFGVPRYLWRQLLQRFLAWAVAFRSRQRFQHRLKFMATLGEMQGYRQLAKNGPGVGSSGFSAE